MSTAMLRATLHTRLGCAGFHCIIHTDLDANMEEGKEKEKRQYNEWPSGLYPVANRGLKAPGPTTAPPKMEEIRLINYMKDV